MVQKLFNIMSYQNKLTIIYKIALLRIWNFENHFGALNKIVM
jgi:hypothetical protein